METIKRILVVLGLCLLTFSGCDNAVVNETETQTDKPITRAQSEINLFATGETSVDDFIISESINETALIKFSSFTNSNGTDYISQIALLGWDGIDWITLYSLSGDEQINGEHLYSFINEYSRLKLYARLFSDFPTTDTATLKISNISIQ